MVVYRVEKSNVLILDCSSVCGMVVIQGREIKCLNAATNILRSRT
jgi:hypothetical protein